MQSDDMASYTYEDASGRIVTTKVPSGFWRGGGVGDDDRFRAAAVCRRGHPESSNLDRGYFSLNPERCPNCGADVLRSCQGCGRRIAGTSRATIPRGGQILSPDYAPPDFCDGCGDPHPWASRQARIYQLENLLDQEDIPEPDRLVVAGHLQTLRNLDPDEDPEQSRRLWKAVQRRAPGLFSGIGRRVLDTVLDRAIRRALGMDG
jgi:hypothetical protein